MRRWSALALALLTCLGLQVGIARGEVQFEALEALPQGEQFRRLELMRLVSAGASPRLRQALLEATPDPGRAFDPGEYTTPLARIVDQPTLVAGAARLFEFTERHEDAIVARMASLESDNPVLISLLNDSSLFEDAILVRTAVADGMEYSGLLGAGRFAEDLQTYRGHTIYLRNVMEFDEFDQQLDRITERAIASVGGKLDAYQRMFDDELVSEQLDRQIESAESIYRKGEELDPRAGELTEELIDSMIRMEAQPNRP